MALSAKTLFYRTRAESFHENLLLKKVTQTWIKRSLHRPSKQILARLRHVSASTSFLVRLHGGKGPAVRLSKLQGGPFGPNVWARAL